MDSSTWTFGSTRPWLFKPLRFYFAELLDECWSIYLACAICSSWLVCNYSDCFGFHAVCPYCASHDRVFSAVAWICWIWRSKWCSTPFNSYVSYQNLPPTCSRLHLFRWDGSRWDDEIRSPGAFTDGSSRKFREISVLLGYEIQWFFWEDFPHHPSQGYLTISSMFNLHFWKVDATWSSNTRLFRAGSSSSRSTICSSITSPGDDWIANLQLHELNRIGQGCCFCISCT